jgi:hypothetical protein
MPETGRVGASGDETADLAAGLDQLVPANVLLDLLPQRQWLHAGIVTQ